MAATAAAFAHFPKMTYARFQKLRAYFSDLKNLWQAELPDLVAAGLAEEIAHEFLLWREENPEEKITERLQKENIKTVSLGDPAYPRLLAEITDPPITLFYRGTMPLDEIPAVAVVGTRRCTAYGRQTAAEIAEGLAARGIAVVSGLALGIDGVVHEAALKTGLTWAVLGSGVDRAHVYPAAHAALADKIADAGGLVLSEYPPGFKAAQYSFPARNRIIAGLTAGTVVIEAPTESGALITAHSALDYNREVMALPHPITSPAGAGGNLLIKQGARLVTSVEDIIETLNFHDLKTLTQTPLLPTTDPIEQKILATLALEPKYIDEIIKETGLPSPAVTGKLTIMEINGLVRNLGGMNYAQTARN